MASTTKYRVGLYTKSNISLITLLNIAWHVPKLGVVIERSRQRNVLWNGHPVLGCRRTVSYYGVFYGSLIKALDCSVSEKSDNGTL